MNTLTKIIIGAALILVVGFYAGSKYSQSRVVIPTNGGQNRTARFGGMGGFISGQVLSKDSQGLTVKLRSGGSMLVFVSSSTPVMKSVVGSFADITVGGEVMITGTTNSDGSVTAASVQLRQGLPNNQ